jgi:large subunit ribosomal protein L25
MATLKADKREDRGTHKARRLRDAGKIPGNIYGHGRPGLAVALEGREVEMAVHHHERLLEILVSGETENVLIKEVQYDPFGQRILHVDMARVDLTERVQVTVAIILRGTPADPEGVLQQITNDLTVECLVTAIPEEITISVNQMKIGDMLKVGDLALPENVQAVTPAETLVCSVVRIAEEEEEVVAVAEGEETAEPEVIGEKERQEKEAAEAEES